MKKQFKVFAWDFHGTLEQGVEVGFWHILKAIAKKRGIAENFKLSEVRKLYGVTVANYLRHFFPESNEAEIREVMKDVATIQNQSHLKKYVRAAPGAIEVLGRIRAAGHKNIVLSNSHPDHIKPLIKIVGMAELIDEVYAIDRHYTHKKFDPVVEKTKVLKRIKKQDQLGRSQLIAIGDRASDINAGIAAGTVTYQFLRRGFPIDETDADYKIYHLSEILREI
ncbi:HAD hydrolase-like protein [Candidatus Curtissbacteria bacterium]|nr:HAD hydrolase-like protein [Candidatus Curtissbacteria bacterium]